MLINIYNKQPSFYVAVVVFLAVLAVWFSQTKTRQNSWGDSTRLASTEALVEHGTWQIDNTRLIHATGDKLLLDGRYYSDKPPMLPALAVGPYSFLHNVLGARLKPGPCTGNEVCAYYWLTLMMIGLPSALMVTLFYWGTHKYIGYFWPAALLTLLFAFGTMVWPYSLVYNNHLPAAASLFISFLLLAGFGSKSRPGRGRLFISGLLAGLAVSLDLISVFIAFALAALAFIYYRPIIVWFVGGGFIPILLMMLFDYQITGNILPPYFSSYGYDYPGSPWNTTAGSQRSPDNIPLHIFRSTLGDRGFISHSPLLLFALAGLIIVLKNRRHPFWLEGGLIMLGMTAQTIFILTRTDNFGGKAYGHRFFIPLLPFLFFFILFALPQNLKSFRAKLVIVGLGAAMALSLISAYQGMVDPWERSNPPLFLQVRAHQPYLTVCSNVAGGLCLDTALNPCAIANTGVAEPRFEPPATMQYTLNANFADQMMLLGYDLATRRVKAGHSLAVIVYWQSLQKMGQNYLQFNHLLDGQLVQRGGYDRIPGETYRTFCWQPGEVFVDGYTVPIAPDAPDGLYTLHTGLYSIQKGQATPLHLVEAGEPTEATSVTLGPIQVGNPPAGVVVSAATPEYPLDLKFGGSIRLRGYDISPAEGKLGLRLYWESLAQTGTNYTAFVHILDRTGQIVTQIDRPPAAGAYPTSLWAPGEIISDELVIRLPDRPPAGPLSIIVGLYDFVTGARLDIDNSNRDSVQLTTFEAMLP